jgi:hypothetical protein
MTDCTTQKAKEQRERIVSLLDTARRQLNEIVERNNLDLIVNAAKTVGCLEFMLQDHDIDYPVKNENEAIKEEEEELEEDEDDDGDSDGDSGHGIACFSPDLDDENPYRVIERENCWALGIGI